MQGLRRLRQLSEAIWGKKIMAVFETRGWGVNPLYDADSGQQAA